jgi:transposase InsO family protein
MPWKETKVMDQRLQFINLYLTHRWSLAALCRQFAISRPTGYKWISRYLEGGRCGLSDQSRRPHHHPQAIGEEIEAVVVEARLAHPHWGPRKLLAWLQRQMPGQSWPVASTIGEIIKRHGLSVSRRRSRKSPPYDQPFVGCDAANRVWSADFKGWFRTGDGTRCDPLTISDNHSRYLLRCQAVRHGNHDSVQPVFEAAFREYGLPEAIRTDNGVPFATTTVGGLSRLSIWWLKLGIRPERIEPGQPQQNGRHERMHRTLKRETASPPRSTWHRQQAAFDAFRDEYNHQRPHEALGNDTPADHYQSSPRAYPLIVSEPAYPDDMILRWVKSQGDISWRNRHIYLSETLAGELVGLRQTDNDRWDIYFGPIKLAVLDSYNRRLIHLTRHRKTNHNPKDDASLTEKV